LLKKKRAREKQQQYSKQQRAQIKTTLNGDPQCANLLETGGEGLDLVFVFFFTLVGLGINLYGFI
jgi:hypothetical protein